MTVLWPHFVPRHLSSPSHPCPRHGPQPARWVYKGHHGAGAQPMCQQGPWRPPSLANAPCPGWSSMVTEHSFHSKGRWRRKNWVGSLSSQLSQGTALGSPGHFISVGFRFPLHWKGPAVLGRVSLPAVRVLVTLGCFSCSGLNRGHFPTNRVMPTCWGEMWLSSLFPCDPGKTAAQLQLAEVALECVVPFSVISLVC